MSRPLARVESESGDGCLRLRLVGEIDLSNAPGLQDQIQARVAETRPRRVVLDLSRVEYIDSQGMMLLLELDSSLRALGTRPELVAPSGGVAADLLALSHVQDLPGGPRRGQ